MIRRLSISPWCKCLLLLVVTLCMALKMEAQALEVPVDVQVPMLLKATTFDRTFTSKLQKNSVIHVGICYQDKYRTSLKEMEELQAALTKPIAGFQVKVSLLTMGEDEDLSQRKEWGGLSVIYITSMRGLDLASLLEQARNHKVLTVATDPKLAPKGVSMSFELVGSRPKFVINRSAAAAEGCDFSSQLLKLATIY